MAQRYKDDVLHELPEVDAVLGTGSYGEIARAVDEVMAPGGLRPCYMGDIQNCVQGGARILSTPSWYAYLRIAEGCDNCCAYCVIPRLRGRYRSRPMNELLDEASELASAGVKELIVIAQDITRYGTDLSCASSISTGSAYTTSIPMTSPMSWSTRSRRKRRSCRISISPFSTATTTS